MEYRLVENSGETLAIPRLILHKLPEAEDDWVRVALYCVDTRETDPARIAHALRLKGPEQARQALLFWKGAGLLESCEAVPAESTPVQAIRERLSTPEVTLAAGRDPAIATLVQECQRVMGSIITQADTNVLVSLYVTDGLPVDLIILAVAHFTAQGHASARYIEKALLGWQRDGIDTYAAAERYLRQEEQRTVWTTHAAELLGLPDGKCSKAERLKIASWYEEMCFDDAMVAEAIAWAGEKKTVAYVHGILRKWYAAGYRTVRDVLNANTGLLHNVQVTNPAAKPVLNGGLKRAPKFRAGGELT